MKNTFGLSLILITVCLHYLLLTGCSGEDPVQSDTDYAVLNYEICYLSYSTDEVQAHVAMLKTLESLESLIKETTPGKIPETFRAGDILLIRELTDGGLVGYRQYHHFQRKVTYREQTYTDNISGCPVADQSVETWKLDSHMMETLIKHVKDSVKSAEPSESSDKDTPCSWEIVFTDQTRLKGGCDAVKSRSAL